MTCGSENFMTHNCVCDTLLAIAEAQDRVSPEGPEGCISGCNTALGELIGDTPSSSMYNTIPVLLTCKSTCELFVGTGARRTGPNTRSIGIAVAFRVADVDPETCCATLELLQMQYANVPTFDLLVHAEQGLTRTGVCITVDLNCFCGVTCLPAVNLPPATA